MKFLIFSAIIFFSANIFPQTKYLIYFKDKGIEKSSRIEKYSPLYTDAINLLTKRAIERRLKNMQADDIITYEDLPLKEEYMMQITSLGIKIENELRWFNAVSAHLNNLQLSAVKNLYFVEKVEAVKKIIFSNNILNDSGIIEKTKTRETDFNYGQSFAQLQLSDVPAVHSKGITGKNVLLGILDTGFDWKRHESLASANVVAEYDFVFKDSSTANDSSDHPSQHSHGTLVFSIAGGFKDSSLIGAAFGSDFLLAKTEDVRSETHVEEDNYAAALEWMESFGVDITSSSLGYSIFDPSTFSYSYSDMDGKTTIVTRAAELAYRRGVLTITAAGNEAGTPWFYIIAPADGFNTLGIGAVDNNNNVAAFSSRGPSFDGRIKPDLVTQGAGVYGAIAGSVDRYTFASGTSVATPIASGIAALLLSAHPHLLNSQMRNILFETADNNKSPDFERGYGLISALDAVQFPNLEEKGGTFVLHKMILEPENINTQSTALHYSTDGENFADVPMNFEGDNLFTYQLPFFFDGDLINFYITYKDVNGNSFRDPVDDTYKFFYGQRNISLNLNLEKSFTNFIVSDPFPNPFIPAQNTFTRILLKSSGNEKLRIRIIDPVGQQVAVYNKITHEGTNQFDWYGRNDLGTLVASGAYYLLIELGDKHFGRKFIVLR